MKTLTIFLYSLILSSSIICEELKKAEFKCSTSLITLLDEIQRDINYANKTINSERLSDELDKRVGELEDNLKQHQAGLTYSQRNFNNSLDKLRKTVKMSETSDIRDVIGKFESETGLLESQAEVLCNADFAGNVTQYMSSLEQSFKQYTRQRIDIQNIKRDLYTLSSLDTVMLSPLEESLIVEQSSAMIANQIAEGALLKAIYRNASEQVNQMDDLIRELRSYSRRRVPTLVASGLIGKALDRIGAKLQRLERRLQESKSELDRLEAEVPRLDSSLNLTRQRVRQMELDNSELRRAGQIELYL